MKTFIAELLPNLIFWGLITGIFLFHSPRWLKGLGGMAVILSIPIVPHTITGFWALHPPDLDFSAVAAEGPTAVMVFGGGVRGREDIGYWPTDNSMMRARTAANIAGKLDLPLYISGGVTSREAPSEAAILKMFLNWQGVRNPVILDENSLNTYQSAIAAKEDMKTHGWSGIIAVSNANHLRRVRAVLRALDVRITALISATQKHGSYKSTDYIPRLYGLILWARLGYETAGSAAYILKGYIHPADLFQDVSKRM